MPERSENMPILIILVLITIALFWIGFKVGNEVGATFCSGGVLAGVVFFVLLVNGLCTYSSYYRKREYTELKEKRNSIMYCIHSNSENTAVLSEEIAEYNAEVLNGRLAMENPWVSFFNYDFYYELPLIETGGLKGEAS